MDRIWFAHVVVWLMLACSSEKSRHSAPTTPAAGAATGSGGEAGTTTSMDTNASTAAGASAFPSFGGGTALPGLPCNGRDAYCSMRYDQACQAATHDSAANSPDYWRYPVQGQSIHDQLNAGIRGLMLSIHDDDGTVSVCRGECVDGSTPLAVVLKALKDFLDVNPREIVTLLVDTALSSRRIQGDFAAQGLDRLALVQAEDTAWPTLGQMIDGGHRVVVFANATDNSNDWMLPREQWLWETGKDWPNLLSMNCNPAVGNPTRPLYVVHHNLVDPVDSGVQPERSTSLAAGANALSLVTQRLQTCKDQFNRVPNFVAVDFSDQGDVVGSTQVLNGVRAMSP